MKCRPEKLESKAKKTEKVVNITFIEMEKQVIRIFLKLWEILQPESRKERGITYSL